ncbi:hypothetical protein FDZ71_17675 [bacterium]|nr:MAG: hypothetical protein FDZ71_17675 [bacterium]
MANELTEILLEIWSEFLEVLPYFLFGVFLEAYIRTKGWHVKIRKSLTKYGYAAIPVATILGLFSPLCACGVLPLTISLILGGLPLAPAMSILVSAPLISPAGYLLAVKNVGVDWANAEVVAGIFMGIYAGLATHFFERRGLDIRNYFRKELPAGDFHDHDYPEEALRCDCSNMFSKRVHKKTGSPFLVFLARMAEGGWKVGKYVALGIVIAVLVKQYMPAEWIGDLLSSTNPVTLTGLALGIVPLHLNQITATTIIFGMSDVVSVSRAAGMVLLVGGPVTALPVMAVFLTFFKPRVFLLYLSICLSGTLFVAYVYQLLGG